MPKVKKDRPTPLQEKLLMAMSLLTCSLGEGSQFRVTAISRIIGGRWTTHRERAMEELVKSKWVEHQKSGYYGWDFYSLTNAGFVALSERYDVKEHEVRRFKQEEKQRELL